MKKPGSCPIEDVAPDLQANRLVNAFIRAESFDMAPAYASMQQKLLEESGLFDETPETLLEMKSILSKYKESLKS